MARAKGKAAKKAPAKPRARKPAERHLAVKQTKTGSVFIRTAATGLVHEVTPELAEYLDGQVDPLTHEVLYEKVASSAKDGSPTAELGKVTQATRGIPDDALATDAAAMKANGGVEKGGASGPNEFPKIADADDKATTTKGRNPLQRGKA